jgi:DNA-binding SARP family transcriptional activator/tetratricopeptide (TPR) repeat protein/type II secretory pathway predicted ATPase ExeA
MASTAPPVGDRTLVRFALFGGLRVWRGAVEMALGPPRQRALLQLLLVAGGEPVSLGEILTALWVHEPAASATNQVHRHIGELRRRFEPELGRREVGRWLLPTSSGYRVAVDATNFDLLQFRSLLREAENLAQASGDSATGAMAQVLEVGCAAPGDDSLRDMPRFVAVEEERVRAAIRAADIALAAGRPGEVLPGLRAIAGAHPFDELLQARVVDCLSGSGRSADALALFDHIRVRLRDELGIDAGAALTQAQSNALAVPAVSTPARAEPAAHVDSAAAVTPPSQLPLPPPGFAGRHAVLAALHDAVGAEPRPVLITGMAGVGKTTFALRYAHELAPHFADGQLYLNLRGFDATAASTEPIDALRDLLEGLGVPSRGQPESVTARSGLLRSILSERQVLIVLDNAHDYQQVELLLPGAGASRVVITSRNRMPGLTAFHHAHAIQLEPFDNAETVEFLKQRLPLSQGDDDRDAMIQLGQACGGLPLALAIIAARASTNQAFPLDLLVREFAQEPTPLDSLNAGSPDLDLSTVFSWSQRGLSEEAARTFVALSAHPGPEISIAAAASMCALNVRRTKEVLTELTLASVLREARPGRFSFHDLVRDHALRLLADNAPDAPARLVNHYLRSTRQAILTFGRPAIASIDETMSGIEPERFATRIDAIKWYVKERHVLHAVCRLALRLGDHRSALMLVLDWRPMSQTRDPTRDLLPFTALALQAVEHVDEPILRAECYRDVAAKLARTGDRERARKYFDLAAATFAELGDRAGQANVYRNMALNVVSDPKEAVDLAGKSVAVARELNNGALLVASLEALAYPLIGVGDSKAAVDAFSECLAIAIDEGFGDFELHARVGIVAALTASHEYEAALSAAEPALALLRGEPAPMSELGLLMAYGDALMALRKDAQAIEVWQRFLALATPGLAEDVIIDRSVNKTGDELIAGVQAKLDALTSVDQSILPP